MRRARRSRRAADKSQYKFKFATPTARRENRTYDRFRRVEGVTPYIFYSTFIPVFKLGFV